MQPASTVKSSQALDVDFFTGLTSHIENFRSFVEPGDSPQQRVLFFDPRYDGKRAAVGEKLLRAMSAGYGSALDYDLVVLRGSTPIFSESVLADPLVRALAREVPMASLTGSVNPRKRAPNLTPIGAASASTVDLADLRRIELHGLLLARKAILGYQNAEQHFVLKGGTHIDQYVRIRDVLVDALDAERLADWILPHVRNGVFLLGSNPGLLPLIQATQIAAQKRFGWEISGNVVGVSSSTENHFSANVAELTDAAHQSHRPTTVLIGVDRDQTRWNECESMINMHDRVSLVDVGDSNRHPSSSFLDLPSDSWPDDKSVCVRCRSGAELWNINPTREDLLPPPRVPVRKFPAIRLLSERKRRLWNLIDSQNALRLHQNVEHHDGHAHIDRHRGIDVDVAKLLGDPAYFDKCEKALRSHVQEVPDLIIMPKHEATDALWELIVSAFGEDVTERVWTTRGSSIDDELARKIRDPSNNRIAILDDAVVTGSTITRLFRTLRATCENDWGSKRVLGFSILSLVSAPDDLQQVINQFIGLAPSPGFAVVDELLVPDRCPWCEEKMIVESLRELEPEALEIDPRHLNNRLEDLSVGGDIERLFVPFGADDDWVRDGSELQGTLIGSSCAATLFAAYACAVHEFCQESANRADERFVVNLMHLTRSFHGPVVRSALLRTFAESELKAEKQSKSFRTAWEKRLSDGLSDEELFEFGWAAQLDKFSAESNLLIYEEIKKRSTRSPGLALLQGRLEVRQLGA